uniref:Major facilitator superfamily (MFS) profile domain-containing protein n=1 Tax=Timema genevievae TaxID=629358 RepID=A0A7R9K4X3_TIMGE|nr:unnamed protein product [Timema genevievae]
MEPQLQKPTKGLAPLVVWVDGSPSISPAIGYKKSGEDLSSPTSSSGLGPESPVKSTSTESSHYSPAMSSIGCEPTLFLSTPSALERLNNPLDRRSCTSLDRSIDSINMKPPPYLESTNWCKQAVPMKNGDVNILKKLPISTVVISNPVYEGVKFKDEYDTKDSICSSSDDELFDEKEYHKKPKVPDGGWGWVVVASSLVISMIADGISFSFGLLYSEFLIHFDESKSKTAWIGSLFMAVPLLSGPIGSALVDKYGCRVMTIIGGIISGIGFVMSAFGESIVVMYLTFGVIAGLGLGLCYVTAVVSIAYWFDKKRTLATGLGACGTGIGTFVYAPMTQYFIEEYGWRGCILLLAGTFFNMCVCGAVMRDPEWWTLEQNKGLTLGDSKRTSASSCGSLSGRSGLEGGEFPGVEEIRKLLKSVETPDYVLTALTSRTRGDGDTATPDGNNGEREEVATAFRSVVNLPTFVRQSETVPLEVLKSLSSNKRVFNLVLENYPSLLMCRSLSDGSKINIHEEPPVRVPVPVTMSMMVQATTKNQAFPDPPISPDPTGISLLNQAHPAPCKVLKSSLKQTRKSHKTEFSRKLQRCGLNQPIHYLKDIRVHRNSLMYRGAILNLNKYRLRASSCPDIYRNSMTTIAKEKEEKWYEDILELLKGMVDFSMFLELHFLMMSLSTILLFTWFIVPYFYLAEHITHNGYTEQDASVMLSAIGITNFIGMVALGWAGDQKWMNVTKTYAGCLIMCGVAVLAMPLFTFNYILLMSSGAMFGLFFASSFSFTPVILVQLIPLERFTTAYGLILLCQGIGNLIGPPLAGWVFDVTQTWDLSFYMAGLWIIVAGMLIAVIPSTCNRKIWGSGPMEMDIDRDSCA